METINVNVKALFGDKVMVKNYRQTKNNVWEPATVLEVKCSIISDKTYSVNTALY